MQLGAAIWRESERDRLFALLAPLSRDIRVLAHIAEPADVLARHYGAQVFEGRTAPLRRDLDLAARDDWWRACIDAMPRIDPGAALFEENQGPPFWLDYAALVAFWERGFGAGTVSLRALDHDTFDAPDIAEELRAGFGIEPHVVVDQVDQPAMPSAAWIARGRQLNALLVQVVGDGKRTLPRPLRRTLMDEIAIPGAPIDPGSLSAISDRFAAANAALVQAYGLRPDALRKPPATAPWVEADPGRGYRASQYLLAFLPRIDAATAAARKDEEKPLAPVSPQEVENSPYAPHNRLGRVDEEKQAPAYVPRPVRVPPRQSGGTIIVGCMKNEAPYILEWIAYHRAIGVDSFLIYTNGCEDGTVEILNRLQAMGVLEHRANDDWSGNSPQQHALNRATEEPMLREAGWIAHIDVDEFINVRCGNGTLDDLFAAMPDATNIAMTWRLFGHGGVRHLVDDFVIDRFERCAPKFCPKPHTAWGFKTLFRNIGAYRKLSCHRPGDLDPAQRDRVKWVNGSGHDITAAVIDKGWRSSRKTIGYDLVQLNHYALRSAESFLIKRARGRALHVDRAIGLNYWARMDWCDHRDITIRRNLKRVQAEYDRLLADDTLRRWHETGLAWHRAKAEDLRNLPEFAELYREALQIDLTATERVAHAATLDKDS